MKAAPVERFLKWSKLCQTHQDRSVASLQGSSEEDIHTWRQGHTEVRVMGSQRKGISYHWHCLEVLAHPNNKKQAEVFLVCFIIVLKFSTDNICLYYLQLWWTFPIVLALVCYCLGAQRSFFFFFTFVSYPLYYGHRSVFFKGSNRNRLYRKGISTKSLEIKDV